MVVACMDFFFDKLAEKEGRGSFFFLLAKDSCLNLLVKFKNLRLVK